mgnify:CR=1 FL=1
MRAVVAVIDEIGPELIGSDPTEQRLIDQALIELDGTPDKGRAGRQRGARRLALAVAKRRGRLRRTATVPLPRAGRTRTCCRCR